MTRRLSRSIIASFTALSALAVPAVAAAQEPEPAPVPAPKAAAAPLPSSVGCTLGSHPGIEDVDAQTSLDVICHELVKKGASTSRELRMGKLGGRILVVLASKDGHGEQRLLVNSLEEIPTAATRIAEAASEDRPVDEVQKVDGVVGMDTRAPRVKPGQMGFKGGIMGAMPMSGGSGAAPGVALGLLYRAGRIGIDSAMRTGGGGGTSTTLTHFTLGLGVHYYWTDGDFAPYTGGGLAIMSYRLYHDDRRDDISGTGFGGYLEGGIEALRTHRTAFTVGVRADIPFYKLTPAESSSGYDPSTGVTVDRQGGPQAQHVIPVSLMIGCIFH